jgi:hypothetical protein
LAKSPAIVTRYGQLTRSRTMCGIS